MAQAARTLALSPAPPPVAGAPRLLVLKAALHRWLRPLAARIPLSPTALTAGGVVAMAAAAAEAARGDLALAGLLILASGALDILDGAVARARGLCSAYGALLDRVADRAADLLIVVGLVLGGQVGVVPGLVLLSSVLLASYASACLEASTRSTVGEELSLRPARIVLLAIGCFAGVVAPVVWLLCGVALLSLVHRLRVAHRLLAPGTPGRRG